MPANHPRPGKPASDEVALAGEDGKALAKLLAESKAYGVHIMSQLVADAIANYTGRGPLLSDDHVREVGRAIAAVNATSELLGRSRVLERSDRVRVFSESPPPDVPFQSFADSPPGVLATPEDAVAFFMSRRPELGIDPRRFGELQRRQAFTLARSCNVVLTERVQRIIGESLRANLPVSEAQSRIRQALESAGVSPANPQYSEMVFRTNAMDAFTQGAYDQGHEEEDTFPCWQYLIIDDERTGDDHRPKGNRYYPRTATFSEVRGNRPFNCRCGMRWVDKVEWEGLKRRGFDVESKW